MPQARTVKVAHLDRNFAGDVHAAAISGAPFILSAHYVELSNAYRPGFPAWEDRARRTAELRARLRGAGSGSRTLAKWRPDLYVELDAVGAPRPGWRDEWIAWMPREPVVESLNAWTRSGRQLVWSGAHDPIGAAFWKRVLFQRWNEGLMPGLYAWHADESALYIGRVLTDLTSPSFTTWAVAQAVDTLRHTGADALIVASKSGWLCHPQAWRATPDHPKWKAGGPLHDTPFAAGEYQAAYESVVRNLKIAGISVVLDDSPPQPPGSWSWMVPPWDDLPDLLLGEESAWP